MIDWLKNKLRRGGKGGVDAGRSRFSVPGGREQKQKKNLLRTLNHYWARARDRTPRNPYQSGPAPRGRRLVLLVVCLVCTAALFRQVDGFGLLGSALADIDYFRISAITVQGAVQSNPERLRDAAGVKVSENLLSLDVDRVAERVRQDSPWVADVDVVRQWPDTVVLRVDEYEPYALLTVGSPDRAELYYLDRRGTPFAPTGAGMELDFPVITGLETAFDEERLARGLQQPLHLLRLVSANDPNLPIQSVSEVHVDDEEGLTVYLVEHPFPIFFGDGEVRKKYKRLRKVLEVLYKPRRTGMEIGRVAYIRMDYLEDKVIVGYSES